MCTSHPQSCCFLSGIADWESSLSLKDCFCSLSGIRGCEAFSWLKGRVCSSSISSSFFSSSSSSLSPSYFSSSELHYLQLQDLQHSLPFSSCSLPVWADFSISRWPSSIISFLCARSSSGSALICWVVLQMSGGSLNQFLFSSQFDWRGQESMIFCELWLFVVETSIQMDALGTSISSSHEEQLSNAIYGVCLSQF